MSGCEDPTENDDNWYSTEQPVRLQGVTVTPTGKQSGNATIQIEVYKLDWHWWWDSEDENLGSYVNREYSSSVLSQKVKATDGRFQVDVFLHIHRKGNSGYFVS